jgi:hypothetical protein
MKTRSHVQRHASEPSEELRARVQSRPFSSPNFDPALSTNHDFSQVDLFAHDPGSRSRPNPIQAKLTIGQRNDPYEQEADRVAEQVMSMPDSATQHPVQREAAPEEEELHMKPLAASITPLVQREALPEEEEELQTKLLSDSIQRESLPEEEEEPVQMKALAGGLLQREAIAEEEEEPVQTKLLQREAIGEEDGDLQKKTSALS